MPLGEQPEGENLPLWDFSQNFSFRFYSVMDLILVAKFFVFFFFLINKADETTEQQKYSHFYCGKGIQNLDLQGPNKSEKKKIRFH